MLPNAPWPERPVPPPATRGIRATARPVPHDIALVCSPDAYATAYAWREFLRMFVCTNCTTSRRIGAVKTAGSGSDVVAAPVVAL